MFTRRQFIGSASLAIGAPLVLGACAQGVNNKDYKEAIRITWRLAEGRLDDAALIRRELVRCATLAPSSHNTQCWKFRVEPDAITLLPDFARRCPAVDPDDHHLFASLGCAAENLVQAALAYGLKSEVRFDAGTGVRISLEPAEAVVSPLFPAIAERQCTRGEFDGKPLSGEELRLLEQAGTGAGVRILFITAKSAVENILEYVVAGNTAQMNDPAFVEELKTWIRFSSDEAVRTGDGLFSGASGSPVLPRWLGNRLFGMFFTPKNENEKYAKQLRSSAGVAVFVSEANDPAHWLEAGRCYERFALQATALGIRNALVNQPVEVAALRPQFADFLSIGDRRPDLVARFGRGPIMPRSLRRPLQSVMA